MSAQSRHQTGCHSKAAPQATERLSSQERLVRCHSKAARRPRIAFDQAVERRQTDELWHPPAATDRAPQTTERLSGQGRLVSQGRLVRQERLAHKERP